MEKERNSFVRFSDKFGGQMSYKGTGIPGNLAQKGRILPIQFVPRKSAKIGYMLCSRTHVDEVFCF